MKKVFILVTIMAFSPLALAKRDGQKGKHGEMKVLKQLDLSDEQKEKIKALREGKKDKMKSLREKAKSDREAFQAAMESDSSKSQLKSLRSKMIKSKQAVRDHQFNSMLEVREVLNPEQRKKFRELKSEMRGKRRGRFEEE